MAPRQCTLARNTVPPGSRTASQLLSSKRLAAAILNSHLIFVTSFKFFTSAIFFPNFSCKQHGCTNHFPATRFKPPSMAASMNHLDHTDSDEPVPALCCEPADSTYHHPNIPSAQPTAFSLQSTVNEPVRNYFNLSPPARIVDRNNEGRRRHHYRGL